MGLLVLVCSQKGGRVIILGAVPSHSVDASHTPALYRLSFIFQSVFLMVSKCLKITVCTYKQEFLEVCVAF